MILEGCRDTFLTGRSCGVHFHRASASVAQLITRVAKKVRLTGPTFVCSRADERGGDRRLPPPATTVTRCA